ncbi:ABC transporter permease [Rothia aeria]|uniref:ABC transporter permease n=1 Tax=Rothia aeria TaxID=172042 RepID=UPI0028892164|nr:ABC transporter permease [Rothia aeria]
MSVTLDKISDAPELSDAPKHTKSAAAETVAARTAATSTAAGRTPASPRRDQPRPRRALPLGAKHYVGLILPAALITLWYVLSTVGVFTAVQLPAPTRVIAAGTELAQRGELATHLVISTQRVVLGFSIGAMLGLFLGAIIGLWGPARIAAAPTIGALRAVPSLAWVPLLLLWIGIGENSKVTLVAIGAFFPVYTTVSAALAHVNPKLVEAARAFGYRGVKLFTTVQLPAVLPSVVSGLRLALAQAWLFLVAAELLGASMGLGYLLTDSQNNGRTDRLLLAIVLLAVLGKLTDALIGVFERWVKAKYPSN